MIMLGVVLLSLHLDHILKPDMHPLICVSSKQRYLEAHPIRWLSRSTPRSHALYSKEHAVVFTFAKTNAGLWPMDTLGHGGWRCVVHSVAYSHCAGNDVQVQETRGCIQKLVYVTPIQDYLGRKESLSDTTFKCVSTVRTIGNSWTLDIWVGISLGLRLSTCYTNIPQYTTIPVGTACVSLYCWRGSWLNTNAGCFSNEFNMWSSSVATSACTQTVFRINWTIIHVGLNQMHSCCSSSL